MKMQKETFMLGTLCYVAIMKKRERLSYDEIIRFTVEFTSRNKGVLIITKTDVVEMCKKNMRYMWFDEENYEIVFRGLSKDDAYHFFWNYGMVAKYNLGETIISKVETAFEEAAEKSIVTVS